MKKYLLILSVLALGFASCSKDNTTPAAVDPAVQAKIDDDAIQAYLVAHPEITATKDASGLYYQIQTEGTGNLITSDNMVTVDYVGTTLKGTQFDASTSYTTGLSDRYNIITGWKVGLLKAKKGSKILLILPSALAYGQFGNGPIAPNTVIMFTITVKDVK
ncbi:FKBP-type peptidyl-prolyl cis-trans isomerase [Mucilaginibacter phyllosphaerae]|uniref:Peptidyl-prolyl cis-trans isomerase n=1 Tax=Mucilaginibacter phyllosphaerae TaxID=1812349 RepID=A0A4Y8A5Y2_9SPHI|nr:FKBP-type peptidyl-prolyl cis-trans isomerase [Mucilaginibacter phyllosphaerae]MBB3971062.1 FKBP-type peptidyl-prolyl cis-trans isomerase [Mucilaginibacter phyllosphaerae]TEW63800.1 hypothetical protein E2R65_18720 [Mucilaginibacter phyllosphaerae]GGH22249.1 hypothetical protein GCM10007352_35440 [Mucilaginibacter phyllosphaerae]